MDVRLPKLADTLTEGTVARWLKRAGEPVEEGEPIAELETEKISSELAAPSGGVLTELLVGEGETVEVGTIVARIGASAEERTPVSAAAAPQPVPAAAPDARAARLREHLRASRERVPAGMCAREIPATADLDRLPQAVRSAGSSHGDLTTAILPASSSHLVMPALPEHTAVLVQAGAERRGRRMLTLCFDRRALDDWDADRLLAEIAGAL